MNSLFLPLLCLALNKGRRREAKLMKRWATGCFLLTSFDFSNQRTPPVRWALGEKGWAHPGAYQKGRHGSPAFCRVSTLGRDKGANRVRKPGHRSMSGDFRLLQLVAIEMNSDCDAKSAAILEKTANLSLIAS